MGTSNIPVPDTSQLGVESAASRYNLENARAAITPPPSGFGQPSPAAFQEQQQPLQQQDQPAMSESLGIPQGLQQPSPYDQMAQFLQARIQKDQQTMHGVKGYLTGLGQGLAGHMMNSLGIETPAQRQQADMGRLLQVTQAQQDAAYKQSETQKNLFQMQMVPVEFPGENGQPGQVVMVPIQHAGAAQAQAARIAATQAQRDQALAQRDPLLDLQRMQGLAVQEAVRSGRDPATDPTVAGLNKQIAAVNAGRAKSPADTAIAEKQEVRDILQPAIQAGEVTADAFTNLGTLNKQVKASKLVPADQKAKVLSWYAVNGSPAATGSQINVRIAAEKERAAGKPYFAFDPATNQRVQTTPDEAAERGYTNLIPVKEGDIEKNRTAQVQFNDVQSNLSRYKAATRNAIQNGLTAADGPLLDTLINKSGIADMQLKISAGGEIQVPVLSALTEAISREARSTAYKDLSPAGKDLIDGYYRTMASVPAYQKALTGIGRLNKEVIDLELANIPNPTMAPSDQLRKLQAFQENVDQGASGIPRMPGIPTLAETKAKFESAVQPAQRLAPPGTQPTHIYNPKTGTAFQIPGVMR